MVSSVWSRLFFGHGHDRDTLWRDGLFVGSLIRIYFVGGLAAVSLETLGFERLVASSLAADLGVFAVAGSIVFVSALNAYTRGGLLVSLAIGMTPSVVIGALGLLYTTGGE